MDGFLWKVQGSGCLVVISITCLNVDKMANYCPVSNLSILSKLTERVTLEQNLPLVKIRQSPTAVVLQEASSTESALRKIHDDLVLNVSQGRSSVLALLELLVAIDTTDYKILLEDISRFGIS